MNHEAELAQLLIRMGTERGMDVETILGELSLAQFPSFVDSGAVRESLLDAVESWWRADLEDRINQLRNQFVDGSASPKPAGTPPLYQSQPEAVRVTPVDELQPEPVPPMASASDPEPVAAPPVVEPPSDATIEGAAVDASTAQDPSEAMPSDATMIWNTRGG